MDKEFRNPSPPPPEEKIAGDGSRGIPIDNSIFDHAWLFETLILALQEVEKQEMDTESGQQNAVLDPAVEGRMSALWDYSATQSVSELMIEHRSPNLIFGLIVRSRSTRLIEICCGILANVTSCVPQFFDELANDAFIVNYVSQLFIGSGDARILIELTRFLRGGFSSSPFVRAFFTSLQNEELADRFFEKLIFILSSSTNEGLLVGVADFLYKTLDYALENGAVDNESESEADKNVENFAIRCCDRRLIEAVREGWSQLATGSAESEKFTFAAETDAYFISLVYQFTLRELALPCFFSISGNGSGMDEDQTAANANGSQNSLSFTELLTNCTFIRKPLSVNLSARRDSAALRMLIVILRSLLAAQLDARVDCSLNVNRCACVVHALLAYHVVSLCSAEIQSSCTNSQHATSESDAAECLADIGAFVAYLFSLDLDGMASQDSEKIAAEHFLTTFYRCLASRDDDDDSFGARGSKLERVAASLKRLDETTPCLGAPIRDFACDVEIEPPSVSRSVASRIDHFISDSHAKTGNTFVLFDELVKLIR